MEISAEMLVGCFGFNGPLRQYFSLYRAVSQREGERGERIDESKNVQTTPTAPTASGIGPCPTVIKIVGRPGTGSLPSSIAPPDHPLSAEKTKLMTNGANGIQREIKLKGQKLGSVTSFKHLGAVVLDDGS